MRKDILAKQLRPLVLEENPELKKRKLSNNDIINASITCPDCGDRQVDDELKFAIKEADCAGEFLDICMALYEARFEDDDEDIEEKVLTKEQLQMLN